MKKEFKADCPDCPSPGACRHTGHCQFKTLDIDPIVEGISDVLQQGADPDCMHCVLMQFLDGWLKVNPRTPTYLVSYAADILADLLASGPWNADPNETMHMIRMMQQRVERHALLGISMLNSQGSMH